MTILLHNLLARAPKMNDADAVTKLLVACNIVDDGVSHYTEEELLACKPFLAHSHRDERSSASILRCIRCFPARGQTQAGSRCSLSMRYRHHTRIRAVRVVYRPPVRCLREGTAGRRGPL